MRLAISHTTRYRFASAVTYGLQQVRLTPKSLRAQRVLDWSMTVTGGKHELSFDDFHRNKVDLVSFESGTEELVIHVEGQVDMTDSHGIVGPHSGAAPLWLFLRQTARTKPGAGCRAILRALQSGTKLDRLHELSAAVAQAVSYQVGASDVDWSAEDALEHGHGVCQDHTHVFLACARAMGCPARYVSGYLMMNDRVDQNATHAWAEAHLDDLGWVGFDISNGISPDTRYVRVATGLDYAEAAPITGRRQGGSSETLDVQIEVAQQQ